MALTITMRENSSSTMPEAAAHSGPVTVGKPKRNLFPASNQLDQLPTGTVYLHTHTQTIFRRCFQSSAKQTRTLTTEIQNTAHCCFIVHALAFALHQILSLCYDRYLRCKFRVCFFAREYFSPFSNPTSPCHLLSCRTSTFPKLQPSHAATSISGEPGGQEPILPAVLEFPEQNQEPFLQSVISELDVNSPNFKLAPVYTLYLCARYRASTHYRPDLQPTERAHKLTVFLHHVANLIQNVVQEQYTDAKILSFWMANSSEFLHFLKSDRHISAFSVQAQEVLAESVQTAFRNLVSIFHVELSQTLNQFLSENIDHDSAAGLVLSVLGSAMALLRRCRVNAALTIQLFSQLFHYINVVCFNKVMGESILRLYAVPRIGHSFIRLQRLHF